MSSGLPVWRIGILLVSLSRAGPFMEASIGVSMRPGAIALAVMPWRAPPRAGGGGIPAMAALAAPEVVLAEVPRPGMGGKLTVRPAPRRFLGAEAARGRGGPP